MNRQRPLLPLLILLLTALLITSCRSRSDADGLVPGLGLPNVVDTNLLFWHTWSEEYEPTLQTLVRQFQSVNPDVTVVLQRIDEAMLRDELAASAHRGFGPDVILTNSLYLSDLADAALIASLPPDTNLEGIWTSLIPAVTRGGVLYGVPFAAFTQVLFYNRDTVDEVPTTLEELTNVSARGERFSLPASFEGSAWGITAFGGRLFDSEGRIALGEGAMTSWLEYLVGRKAVPGVEISTEVERLREEFVTEDISYYIGNTIERAELMDTMGDALGVSMLPRGSGNTPPGPVLNVEALALGTVASEAELDASLRLIEFLKNPAQQNLLISGDTDRLPANSTVQILPSMPQDVLEHARQLRGGFVVGMDRAAIWKILTTVGDQIYERVLSGVLAPRAAVNFLTEEIITALGEGAIAPPSRSDLCVEVSAETLEEPLVVYHGWTETEEETLRALAREYEALCPGVQIETVMVPDNRFLNRKYRTEVNAGGGPDILIDSTQWMVTLAEAGLIRNMVGEVDTGFLQQFLPTAQLAIRYDGGIYGLPESVNNAALLYRKSLAPSQPQLFDDILLLADMGRPFAFPLRHDYMYWGMPAFGSHLLTAEGEPWPTAEGQVAWLEWLREAVRHPNITFTENAIVAENRLMSGEAAYTISRPSALKRIQNVHGLDDIGVALLPIGPVEAGSPLMELEMVMFNPALRGERLDLALAFGAYLVSKESQSRLAETGVHVTANTLVDLSEHPILRTFRDQATLATVVSQGTVWTRLQESWDLLYQSVVIGRADPAEAVDEFRAIVEEVVAAEREAEAAARRAEFEAGQKSLNLDLPALTTPEARR
jgi:ABC-type glycerol-3-phosphate transport system substrate-binding protein